MARPSKRSPKISPELLSKLPPMPDVGKLETVADKSRVLAGNPGRGWLKRVFGLATAHP